MNEGRYGVSQKSYNDRFGGNGRNVARHNSLDEKDGRKLSASLFKNPRDFHSQISCNKIVILFLKNGIKCLTKI